MAKEIDNNVNSKLELLQSIIKHRRKENLSIRGKAIVIKTFLVSQLLYVMQLIGLPRLALQEINRLLYKYM